MMSEKRFKLDFDNHSQGSIMDRQDKYGQYCRLYDFGEVGRQQIVDLLNKQQSIIEQLQENKELKHWKKRIIEYLTDWFNKTEYLTVLYKINEINNEIGLDSDE